MNLPPGGLKVGDQHLQIAENQETVIRQQLCSDLGHLQIAENQETVISQQLCSDRESAILEQRNELLATPRSRPASDSEVLTPPTSTDPPRTYNPHRACSQQAEVGGYKSSRVCARPFLVNLPPGGLKVGDQHLKIARDGETVIS